VCGAYMSPVSDAYGKPGLAPAAHRVDMCRGAARASQRVMVDEWEATRLEYTRTLQAGGESGKSGWHHQLGGRGDSGRS